MKETLILGVDVSKATLDIFFKPCDLAIRIANNKTGFREMAKQLKDVVKQDSRILVVMEHTGKYSLRFESYLRSMAIDYCKLPAMQIKRSVGLVRGKNDKIDAQRIAGYAWLRRDILQPEPPVTEQIGELKELLALRSKMVIDRAGYINRLKELKSCCCCTSGDYMGKTHQKIILFLNRQIAELEEKIKALINAHDELQKTCGLLRSIKGIGWIVAAYMICCTANFKRFGNARKFNCYAGLAPFDHSSGSSIKGKARVSHLANKTVKSLLNLAACCAIRCDQEMKTYYQKRVAEGKRKMSCLNIIRSKLVARMFAVVKRQTPYLPVILAA